MQRWEREQGLPVRRLPHNRLASVYAYAHEIDQWWEQRRQLLVVDRDPDTPPPVDPAVIGEAPEDVRPPLVETTPPAVAERPRRRNILALFLAAVLMIAVGARWSSYGTSPAEITSIAVVPFEAGGSGDGPIVGASVSEEFVSYLARVRSVRVLGGASNGRATSGGRSITEAARSLGADAVISGKLRTRPEGVDVELRLTLARSGAVIWTGHYAGPVQTTDTSRGAALSLVADLCRTLWPAESVPDAPARVREAYLAYMRGRYQLAKRDRDGLLAAEAEFNLALEKDPRFADAAAGLADTLILMGVYGVRDHAQTFAGAKAAAREALSYDADNAEAYTALAFATEVFDHDWVQAEARFRRALTLNPSSATAHHWYALLLDSSLRGDEAVREMETARALEPLSANINSDLGMVLAHHGHVKEAIAQFTRTLAMDPTYVDAHAELGYAYREAGDDQKAMRSFRRAGELGADPLQVHFNIVICEVRRGNLVIAKQMVDELRQPGRFPTSVTDIHVAQELIAVGDARGLDMMLAHPEYVDVNWLIGSIYRPLWNDPRYHQLLRRAGLLEAFNARARPHVGGGN